MYALRVESCPFVSLALNLQVTVITTSFANNLLQDDPDNIPMRIMLLLMDEVFDLKNKNQWLRRRIVAILRQIIKATMGDSINRYSMGHTM